jgi:hypothetical protein
VHERWRASREARGEREKLEQARAEFEASKIAAEQARNEAKGLFEAGDYDAALERVFGVKTTDLQKKILQKKAAIAQEPPEIAELRAKVAEMESRDQQAREAQAKRQAQLDEQRRYAEFTRDIQAELAQSEYEGIPECAQIPGFVQAVAKRVRTNAEAGVETDMDHILWEEKNRFDTLLTKMITVARPDLVPYLDGPQVTQQTQVTTPAPVVAPVAAPAPAGGTQVLPSAQADLGRVKPATLPQRAAAEPTARPQFKNRNERRLAHFQGAKGVFGG